MIVISIESTQVIERTGNKDGKDWFMRFQQVSITGHSVDGFLSKHPRETTIHLKDGEQPYAVGNYVLASTAFYFGNFGRFIMGRIKLQPLAAFMAEIQKQFGKAELKAA